MRKLYILGFFVIIFLGCKEDEKEKHIASEEAKREVVTQEWAKKTMVNSKATAILSSWAEYNAFDDSIETLYDAENLEDLAIGVEDIIEKQKLLSKSNYPEEYDIPQIKSRQKVVLTYLLKLKADLEYRLRTDESIQQFITANNAMREQFNVAVNNPLDNDLILEEER